MAYSSDQECILQNSLVAEGLKFVGPDVEFGQSDLVSDCNAHWTERLEK